MDERDWGSIMFLGHRTTNGPSQPCFRQVSYRLSLLLLCPSKASDLRTYVMSLTNHRC